MRMFTPSQTLRAGRREAHPSLRTSCLHRLLVLGVDVLDVLPDKTLGIRQIVAALAKHIGGMEGRHSLYTFYVVPLAAVFRYSEVLIYDRFSRWAAESSFCRPLRRRRGTSRGWSGRSAAGSIPRPPGCRRGACPPSRRKGVLWRPRSRRVPRRRALVARRDLLSR